VTITRPPFEMSPATAEVRTAATPPSRLASSIAAA
jgi:hypothetical protein